MSTLKILPSVSRKDESNPPRSFSDYIVNIDERAIPEGVELVRKI